MVLFSSLAELQYTELKNCATLLVTGVVTKVVVPWHNNGTSKGRL